MTTDGEMAHRFHEAHRGSAKWDCGQSWPSTGYSVQSGWWRTISFAIRTDLVLRSLQQLSERASVTLCGRLVLLVRHGWWVADGGRGKERVKAVAADGCGVAGHAALQTRVGARMPFARRGLHTSYMSA